MEHERERMIEDIGSLSAKLKIAEDALGEITRGMGRFSREPLEHANNTIEDMKELAENALKEMSRA